MRRSREPPSLGWPILLKCAFRTGWGTEIDNVTLGSGTKLSQNSGSGSNINQSVSTTLQFKKLRTISAFSHLVLDPLGASADTPASFWIPYRDSLELYVHASFCDRTSERYRAAEMQTKTNTNHRRKKTAP